MSILLLFIAGAMGALVKDILEDNQIKLPKKINSTFSLGFLGGMVTGGVVGYLIDQNPTTAFLSGYVGTSVILNLLLKKNGATTVDVKVIIRGIIRGIAKQYGVPENLAVRVAECESNLDASAIHINQDGSKDRGLFQINNKWHPEVSDKDAFDIIASTKFFCEAYKKGMLHWWNATKTCWDTK